jgi:hypothetical protein
MTNSEVGKKDTITSVSTVFVRYLVCERSGVSLASQALGCLGTEYRGLGSIPA